MIGDLRHQVLLQRYALLQDALDEPIETWATISTAWAKISPVTGQEFFAADQLNSSVDHKITVRYIAGLSPKDRVLFGTRIFNIEAILDTDERRRYLTLMASELKTSA